jgi:hypothetical protein
MVWICLFLAFIVKEQRRSFFKMWDESDQYVYSKHFLLFSAFPLSSVYAVVLTISLILTFVSSLQPLHPVALRHLREQIPVLEVCFPPFFLLPPLCTDFSFSSHSVVFGFLSVFPIIYIPGLNEYVTFPPRLNLF